MEAAANGTCVDAGAGADEDANGTCVDAGCNDGVRVEGGGFGKVIDRTPAVVEPDGCC